MRKLTLHRIGFWSWGIDPTRLVDPSWAEGERDLLVSYLRHGQVWKSFFGYSFCRFQCGIPYEEMGTSDLTDGHWLWPEGLWHYVAEHRIALPDAFLDHARSSDFAVPDSDCEAIMTRDAFPSAAGHRLMDWTRFIDVSDDVWEQWGLDTR